MIGIHQILDKAPLKFGVSTNSNATFNIINPICQWGIFISPAILIQDLAISLNELSGKNKKHTPEQAKKIQCDRVAQYGE